MHAHEPFFYTSISTSFHHHYASTNESTTQGVLMGPGGDPDFSWLVSWSEPIGRRKRGYILTTD
eukprot:4822641-Pyramimonas_sp.AAC.1